MVSREGNSFAREEGAWKSRKVFHEGICGNEQVQRGVNVSLEDSKICGTYLRNVQCV